MEGAVGAAITAGELAQACGEGELSAQVEAYQAEIDALVLGAYPTDDEIEEEALYMFPAYADLLCREADISAGAASDSDIELDKLQRVADSAESSMGWQEDYVLKAEAEVKEAVVGARAADAAHRELEVRAAKAGIQARAAAELAWKSEAAETQARALLAAVLRAHNAARAVAALGPEACP